jgi:hypothetical protein
MLIAPPVGGVAYLPPYQRDSGEVIHRFRRPWQLLEELIGRPNDQVRPAV